MPRRPRPDIEPEIVLPDNMEQEARANQAIDDDWRARVYPRGERPINDDWTVKPMELQRRLARLRSIKAGINEGLLHFMMEHCDLASTVPKLDANGAPEFRNGGRVLVLRRIGCRLTMTQERSDDDQALPADSAEAGERMSQIVEPNIIETCASSNAPPHVRHPHEMMLPRTLGHPAVPDSDTPGG